MPNAPFPIPNSRSEKIEQIVVTAKQMQAIEGRVFQAGMPVAALMEKVAGLVARRIESIESLYPKSRAGVLVGPGHNGGDALVVARELHFRGYPVTIYCPFTKLKELTQQHARYARSLGIPFYEEIAPLQDCDFLVDGLFGFGLERPIKEPLAKAIKEINRLSQPVLSIDIPSGLHSDTGEVMGTAIRATRTFCLGLWKLGLLQDAALEYVGNAELIDFDLPLADIGAVLGNPPAMRRITAASAIASLPLPRPPAAHKYQLGHLLLICGSRKYGGAAILAGLGARASGVGMLSMAVPESLKPILNSHLPEALILGCPETESGAIASLPEEIDWSKYAAIACGPGLSLDTAPLVERVLAAPRPLLLDADGLNILSQLGASTLLKREAATILTPHLGEFKRLFPYLADSLGNRARAAETAARECGAVVVLKGARVAIAHPDGAIWINPESSPALARGGSGDVLTGLMGGLIAQAASSSQQSWQGAVQTSVWWHARAAQVAALERTELGVDAFTLTQYLLPALPTK